MFKTILGFKNQILKFDQTIINTSWVDNHPIMGGGGFGGKKKEFPKIINNVYCLLST
jgi:hypothetical protein